jgi:Holliday junction DNA helicase RuvA
VLVEENLLISSQMRKFEQKEEAVSALVMLGFAAAASQKTIEKIIQEQPALKVEQLIKLALKMM